ncbi:MAG: hypothetical protein ACI9FD_003810 [Gammaproteobacteria bacterium]|jgi:hypothetical protein
MYGGATTLSAIFFNTLMGIAGGIIGGYTKTRDPFWMMSGALCGNISVASGIFSICLSNPHRGHPSINLYGQFMGMLLWPYWALSRLLSFPIVPNDGNLTRWKWSAGSWHGC